MPMHANPPPRVPPYRKPAAAAILLVRVRSFNMMIRTSRDSTECVRLEEKGIRREGRKEGVYYSRTLDSISIPCTRACACRRRRRRVIETGEHERLRSRRRRRQLARHVHIRSCRCWLPFVNEVDHFCAESTHCATINRVIDP